MAATLEGLMNQLANYQPYQAMTQEEMNEAAENRYRALYDQKRLSAQHAYEQSDAALARELTSLQDTYSRERDRSAAETENIYRQAGRQALSRGMQRSSYHNANLVNIHLAGEAAQQKLGREQMQAEGDVNEQRTLLSRQLAAQIAEYDAQQRSDVLGYLDELEAREYDRTVQSHNTYTELAMKLYEYQHQLEVEAAEQARWQAEFNAKYGDGSSSGSRKKKTTSSSAASSSSSAAASGGSAGGKTTQKMMLH